ncbi:phage tail sheath family protein [Endozoicomonas lisbonensis]|uniref:Phage tail sheath protein FI n=1 Tax=Endozoicomonas lisbonensis TaxID=3120522 RepID=A0ABV2SAV9_9GAMM
MAQYKTPNVYVQEKSIFPPSVAEVATAIPAFIGRTEISGELKNIPQRITSMVEYAALFGGPGLEAFNFFAEVKGAIPHNAELDLGDTKTKALVDYVESIEMKTDKQGEDKDETLKPVADHLLYPMLEHFFANGGGACHVVSIGSYVDPDINDAAKEKKAFSEALGEIAKVDEVTLLVLSDAIRLGASDYYELCQSAMNQCRINQDRFTIIDTLDSTDPFTRTEGTLRTDMGVMRNALTQDLIYGAAYYPYLEVNAPRYYNEDQVIISITGTMQGKEDGDDDIDLSGDVIMGDHVGTPMYALLKTELNNNKMVLPPAAAMAGIYARVDGTRGVWKAPANVGVSGVLGPVQTITNSEQADMNVDADSGKSVNAIRAFTGKGTLVWGARTLAGNDNEWRYVPVRRLFNMVEESVQKATAFAVFEPNVPLTWLKLRTMISSYLENLWKQGALFGATADQAFFVNVGLGQTMTEDDINNGIMNIEIGMAAVRPAEFIVLTFSHKSISA